MDVTFPNAKLCAEMSDLGTGAKVFLTSGACLITSMGRLEHSEGGKRPRALELSWLASQLARLAERSSKNDSGNLMASY